MLTETVDHGCNQAQHATRTLELGQRRPVRVEPFKDLRMNRIGSAYLLLIVHGCAIGRELGALLPIKVAECSRRHVALLESRAASQWFEKPAADDLEALERACWSPRCIHATHGISQPIQRLVTADAADFSVIYRRLVRRVRRGKRNDYQAAFGLCLLCERLREGELCLEAAARQIAAIVQLARI